MVREPDSREAVALAAAQLIAVAAVLVSASRRRDRGLAVLAAFVLVQWSVAILAVRAVRGNIEFFLVAWASLIGFLSFAVIAAWLIPVLRRMLGRVRASAHRQIGMAAVPRSRLAMARAESPGLLRDPTDAECLAGRHTCARAQ